MEVGKLQSMNYFKPYKKEFDLLKMICRTDLRASEKGSKLKTLETRFSSSFD